MDKIYYYKISLDKGEGMAMQAMIDKGVAAVNAANQLTSELGADFRTDEPGTFFEGCGIGSLIFQKQPNLLEYQLIGIAPDGYKEYIPNMKTKQGKALMNRIAKLPCVTASDMIRAFGIKGTEGSIPAWFRYRTKVYARCTYPLSWRFTEITEEEFQQARERMERQQKQMEERHQRKAEQMEKAKAAPKAKASSKRAPKSKPQTK